MEKKVFLVFLVSLAMLTLAGCASDTEEKEKGQIVSGIIIGDPEDICDDVDDDLDGATDDGCNEDNDQYCALGKTVIGLPAVCPNGGGDCQDDNADIFPGAAETCNGLDDDCDTTVDEDETYPGYSLVEECYTGAPGTEDVGPCQGGFRECQDGVWATCIFEVTPSAELCDSEDNDCDNEIDDDFPLKGMPCDGPDSDLCPFGFYVCKADQSGLECEEVYPLDIVETCDGEDNDCDGEIDEDFPLKGQVCDGADSDLCQNGTYQCNVDGTDVECQEAVENIPELCNGADDDCDGEVDEDFPLKGAICDGADSDLCQNGTYTCQPDGTAVECVNENPANIVEVCDGADNDCDGEVDEDFPLKGTICDGADSDLCQNGTYTCQPDGTGVECVNENPANIVETCNGADDDCDGEVDENLTQACGTDTGECVAGTETCADGQWVNCTAIGPVPEVCDGADNDCDETVDEDLSQACGTDVGECVAGTETCADGQWVDCTAIGPVPEVCDGADNDCDGEVDEELNQACGIDVGECVAGTETCEAGQWVNCTAVGPSDETCNDKDDDCDGATDDGFVGKGEACDGDDADSCKNGFGQCSPDGQSVICEETRHFTEICDGFDNDCDGEVDEDYPEKGQACDGTDSDLCQNGSYVCRADKQAVECQESIHKNELCANGADDDCNGLTDEYCPRSIAVSYLAASGLLMGYEGNWEMTTGGLYVAPLEELAWPDDYILSRSPPNFSYATVLGEGDCLTFWYQNKKVGATVFDPYGVREDGEFTGECAISHPFSLLVDEAEAEPALLYNWQEGCRLVYCAPLTDVPGTCQTNNNFMAEICGNGLDDDCDSEVDELVLDFGCAVDGNGDAEPDVYCDPLRHPMAGFYGADEDCDNGEDDDCDGLADAADPACQE